MDKSTYSKILDRSELNLNNDWLKIQTIDMHTGGEPLRVILGGFPELQGKSVLDYRRYCKNNLDHLRTALMFEPRGHSDMYGCILTPPNDENGDFGIIFLHNEGYSTMCGHAIIAISTLAAELKWIEIDEGDNTIQIDAPCGRIESKVNILNGEINHVRFHCVPSFVLSLDRKVEIDGLGTITYDIAYGGAFYAYVDMAKNDFNFNLSKSYYQTLIDAGRKIKLAVITHDKDIIHPYEEDLSFLYGTIFIDNNIQPSGANSKNVCVFADGEVDRCPTGSGVSGRMAIHSERNELSLHEKMRIESITGSIFEGSYVDEVKYGNHNAVIPEVKGTAHITGQHTFIIDPNDPMKSGFILR